MNFTIIGGGLVGSLLSIFLKKKGMDVTVFEKRADIRINQEERGRSINMALSDRGWLALHKAGLADAVKPFAIPMFGRMIHSLDGIQTFQRYGEANQAIYSISRNLLTQILINESEKLGVKYAFNQRCIDIDLKDKHITFEEYKSETLSKRNYDVLVGTDGAFSEVRTVLTKTDRFDYHQWYLKHGYKELHIPAHADGTHQLDKNALHIWPRGNFMLIALPNIDGSFTCTLFLPFEGENSFASIKNDSDVITFFKTNFSDTSTLMPTLVEDYFHNPTASLINVSCFPWSYQDSVVLMGDAAHAIVPFYGQGMISGFEDVRVFDELLDLKHSNLKLVFEKFQNSRKPNADAIAQMALDNFIEMRDKVGDAQFLLRKKIDAHLHELYKDQWIPQYTLVTFSPNVPYAEAKKRGDVQSEILDRILQIPQIETNWETLDYTEFLQ